jgi:hypothetical protein
MSKYCLACSRKQDRDCVEHIQMLLFAAVLPFSLSEYKDWKPKRLSLYARSLSVHILIWRTFFRRLSYLSCNFNIQSAEHLNE